VKKEANRYIHNWSEEKIAVENGRWGPFIRFGKKMIKLPRKEDGSKYNAEEAASLTLDDVKKMIENRNSRCICKKRKESPGEKGCKKSSCKKGNQKNFNKEVTA
jgi:DNA topoisomerase-1